MRGVLLSLVCAAGLLALTPTKSIASFAPGHAVVSAAAPVFAMQQPGKSVDININTNTGGGGRWYRNPMWIAILAIGAVVLLMLIVMAARGGSGSSGGGGTTIVK
jgi:hypothetical protein